MKTFLVLIVMVMVSFLAKADDIRCDDEIVIREPINTVRFISGAE